MSLRPALFDLWPSPWPEDCEHSWNMVYSLWEHSTYHCSICNTDLWKQIDAPFPETPRAPRKTTAKCEKL
ncbi:hypothetical protein LCGC14_1142550 [marine sediment metagenome]|uniref:Uncharacterized protein n=1 Tax=marine sediment metagenome TaxID=412755 RepID=A0A0F9MKV2_9ZZZZ